MSHNNGDGFSPFPLHRIPMPPRGPRIRPRKTVEMCQDSDGRIGVLEGYDPMSGTPLYALLDTMQPENEDDLLKLQGFIVVDGRAGIVAPDELAHG